jgi:hypothetical protein
MVVERQKMLTTTPFKRTADTHGLLGRDLVVAEVQIFPTSGTFKRTTDTHGLFGRVDCLVIPMHPAQRHHASG